jgi:hypothetical protein
MATDEARVEIDHLRRDPRLDEPRHDEADPIDQRVGLRPSRRPCDAARSRIV